jgi:GxxExxY protein
MKTLDRDSLETVAHEVIGLAIEVHRELGPGLLESTYNACLFHEIKEFGYKVEKEKALPVNYKGLDIDCGYRIDLLVEDTLLIELKSVSKLTDIHIAQTLTYLKLGGYELALLINFNVNLLKHGIKRLKI